MATMEYLCSNSLWLLGCCKNAGATARRTFSAHILQAKLGCFVDNLSAEIGIVFGDSRCMESALAET
jgi:hypothetical protein